MIIFLLPIYWKKTTELISPIIVAIARALMRASHLLGGNAATINAPSTGEMMRNVRMSIPSICVKVIPPYCANTAPLVMAKTMPSTRIAMSTISRYC